VPAFLLDRGMWTMTMKTAVLLFRFDLRLSDHEALISATRTHDAVLPLFVLDEDDPEFADMGEASRWRLRRSLESLAAALRERGSRLFLRKGKGGPELAAFLRESGADSVFMHRPLVPASRRLWEARTESFDLNMASGALLHSPARLLNLRGQPYRVFTPFWKSLNESNKSGRLAPRSRTSNGPDLSDRARNLESIGVPARRGPGRPCANSWTRSWENTSANETFRPAPRARACRRICASARSARCACGVRPRACPEPSPG